MTQTVAAQQGTLAIPEAEHSVEPTSMEDLEAAVAALQDHRDPWVGTGVAERISLLDQLMDDVAAVAEEWSSEIAALKGVPEDSPMQGEGWLTGPIATMGMLRRLRTTLEAIQETGRPRPPDVSVRADGRIEVAAVPDSIVDRIFFPGFEGSIRLKPGVGMADLLGSIGRVYREDTDGGVALVLGAGNVSAIPAMDLLTKLFAENRVCLLKMNPVNERLGPLLERAFAALVDRGVLRVVYGGKEVGSHLTTHDGIDEIHITGSDKTHDAIMFGSGEEGEERKAANDPILDKPMTSELGNVTPVIVVPGPWSQRDFTYQGDHLATTLTSNAGFNCIATRVIVQHAAWRGRRDLLDAVRDSLRRAEPRAPYYPGAEDRWGRFLDAYPRAETYGPSGAGQVPWTLIPDLDPAADDQMAFTTEGWCGLFGEVGLAAPTSIPAFLEEAVAFCNERLWGTLGATILVHPRTLEDPANAAAVEQAVDDLRYGTVAVNHWTALAFFLSSLPWGAAPGHTPDDIQSGRGWVHNTYLIEPEQIEKSVLRGPFRMPTKPWWFHTNRTAAELGDPTVRLEQGDWSALLPLTWATLRS